MPSLIETTNLTHCYRPGTKDAVRALHNISMSVYRGEMLAITGRNGSGKSTLARHFNALLTPKEGTVRVSGLITSDKNNIKSIRRIVGMVFQNPENQLVSSVVEEDIAFGPENLGLPRDEIIERVNWALETLGLENLRFGSPHNLSSGQKQKVAIAGVLAMKPDCIVLDEPTANLDPRARREVLDSAFQLNREEGITIVLLTHFMNEVIFCDRMIVMDEGEIVMQGPPRELFQQGERITSLGLDFPVAARLASGLHREGFPITPDIIQTEELVESICRLK